MVVYSIGGGELIYEILNAVTMCLNENGNFIHGLIAIGGLVGAFIAYCMIIYGNFIEVVRKWGVPALFIMNMVFVPTTDVMVVDTISNIPRTVSNVPYGLAVIASTASNIGKVLTEVVEKNFSTVDYLKYHKTGMVFGSNILEQMKNYRIIGKSNQENMRNFVGQCVKYDIMINNKYSFDDLMNTNDIWGLVSSNPSEVRGFYWTSSGSDSKKFVTCKDATRKFSSIIDREVDKNLNTSIRRLFSGRWFTSDQQNNVNEAINQATREEFKNALSSMVGFLGGLNGEVSNLLKQSIMINSIRDSAHKNSLYSGNISDFSLARASIQMNNTLDTIGRLAAKTLPMVMAVFQGLLYACFIFIIPFCMVPNGYKFLINWIFMIVWIHTWPPLFAVLNFIMTVSAQAATEAEIASVNGFSMINSYAIIELNHQMALIAGYLSIAVPFIGFALIKGVSGLVNLSSQVMGNVSQASGFVSREASTGNFSFGNISLDNTSTDNISKMHYDYNSFLGVGGHTLDTGNVQIKKDSSNDRTVINREFSRGGRDVIVSGNELQHSDKNYQESAQKAKDAADRLAKGKTVATNRVYDFAKSLSTLSAERISGQYGMSIDEAKQLRSDANVVSQVLIGRSELDQVQAGGDLSISGGLGLGPKGASQISPASTAKVSSEGTPKVAGGNVSVGTKSPIGISLGGGVNLGANSVNVKNYSSSDQVTDSYNIGKSKSNIENFMKQLANSDGSDDLTKIARSWNGAIQENIRNEEDYAFHKNSAMNIAKNSGQSFSIGLNESYNVRDDAIDIGVSKGFSYAEAEKKIEKGDDAEAEQWIRQAIRKRQIKTSTGQEALKDNKKYNQTTDEFLSNKEEPENKKWDEKKGELKLESLKQENDVLYKLKSYDYEKSRIKGEQSEKMRTKYNETKQKKFEDFNNKYKEKSGIRDGIHKEMKQDEDTRANKTVIGAFGSNVWDSTVEIFSKPKENGYIDKLRTNEKDENKKEE